MSEIDPWALPQDAAGPGGAGLPAGGYIAAPPVQPLNTTLPFVVIGFGVLYVLVSIIQIFELSHQASVAAQIGADTGDQIFSGNLLSQLQSSQNMIENISWAALAVFLGALFSIRAWQGSLNVTLGSFGARQAVFRRAGFQYFRATWMVSIVLSLLLSIVDRSDNVAISDIAGHDHQFMAYYGVRALAGAVLVFFAFRLKKFSEEGVARITGAYAAQAQGY